MGKIWQFIVFIFYEFVPLPGRQATINPDDKFAPYLQAIAELQSAGPDASDQTLLSSSQRLFDSDVARQASINTRASELMAAIGLAATLVTGIGLTTFKDAAGLPPLAFNIMFFVYILVLLYLAVTVIIAFQVQGYIPRSTPDPSDLNPASGDKYARTVACKLLQYTVVNYKINNVAAVLLYSGQKCFRNALLVLVFGGLTAAVITMYTEKRPDPSKLAQALAHSAGCKDLPTMKMDVEGAWRGTCLYNDRVASVTVTPEGATSFKP